MNSAIPFRGNRPRAVAELARWHGSAAVESVTEPSLPIFDAHHHLYGQPGHAHHYRRQDFARDVATGHRVFGTLYVEAFESNWRTEGPVEWRSLGEVEAIARESAEPIHTAQGPCLLAAGVVSHVDLALGDAAAPILEAHMAAADGKLRGIRQHATFESGEVGRFVLNARQGLLAEAGFRRGFALLEPHGLAFDALVFHTQLADVASLADAFPHTRIVLNHVGIPLGAGEYAARAAEVKLAWQQGMRSLARRPNVDVKISGMGMPLFGLGFEHGQQPALSGDLERAWAPLVDTCLELFGAQRCMLASNFPVDKQSCGYRELWNAFKRITHPLSRAERAALFYRTACGSYALPAVEAAGDRLLAAT